MVIDLTSKYVTSGVGLYLFHLCSAARIEEVSRNSEGAGVRNKITFRELHTMYGRPILTDLTAWKHAQRSTQQDLINL